MALLESVLRPFFSQVFLSVHADGDSYFVQILRFKSTKLVEKVTREFRRSGNLPSAELVRFIRGYKKKYPFLYIATLIDSGNQGAFGSDFVDSKGIDSYLDDDDLLCLQFDRFGAYVRVDELNFVEDNYKNVGGVDYVFSPFVILNHLLEFRLDFSLKLYAMCDKSAVTIFVANVDGTYFGRYFNFQEYEKSKQGDEPQDQSEKEEQSEEIEDDTWEHEDSFEDDDYKDDLEEIDLSMLQRSIDEIEGEEALKARAQEKRCDLLGEILQSVMREFYDLGGDFIEEIVILDSTDITQDNLGKIQDRMLIDIVREDINIRHNLSLMMINEYKEHGA